MIITLFVLGLIAIVFGTISIVKKKHLLGWMFVLMGILLATVGAIVVYLYPHTLPF